MHEEKKTCFRLADGCICGQHIQVTYMEGSKRENAGGRTATITEKKIKRVILDTQTYIYMN